ncbi:hypothetical protein [Acinetobacter chinensis]|uniref:hypothetical protein n=1 Tax=Acinetobacter chinensis TaxID=2004650 RepID=UPI0029341AE7|nr:hypothetical protein [Acinetobacter chinensis]WOE40684.1 hypothetical protein QSG87_12425 [Acinetobacter chinensis]
MSVMPSLAAGLVQLQALANFLDMGSDNATFIFYDDSKPNSTNVAANNSAKLVTLVLPKPCFKQLLIDGIELHPSGTAVSIKTGTAIWARLLNGNGVVVADFSVGTDIVLNNEDLVLGASLTLNSIILKPLG